MVIAYCPFAFIYEKHIVLLSRAGLSKPCGPPFFMRVTSKQYVTNWVTVIKICPQLPKGRSVCHEVSIMSSSKSCFPLNSQRSERAISVPRKQKYVLDWLQVYFQTGKI